MCDTTSHVPPPRELVGEQQGGAEEDGQTDPSLKEMFQEGMSTIAIHRKENVFQDLDKRTLTEEEQAVIRGGWSTNPDGQRPKVVDRASLEGTIFVGAFRGKGFQGKSGRKVVMRKLQNTRNENNENEAREAEDASDVTPDHRTTSGAGEEAVPLSQNGETPVMFKGVCTGKTDCLSGEASAEQTVKEEAPPSATRRSSRQRTVRAVDPEIDPKTDGYLEKVACANDKDAAAILGKLSKKMVAYILESLGTVNPEKAVSIREILDSSIKSLSQLRHMAMSKTAKLFPRRAQARQR
eukprot:jgi/Picre1/29830/NNA_005212.t1